MKDNFISNLVNRTKFHFIAHKHQISSKGDCYARYIIDKYINLTDPDNYIEAYEEMIARNENRVRQMDVFDRLYQMPDGTENNDMLHFVAANLALGLLLMTITEKEAQQYLDLITDAKARHFINVICHPNKKIQVIDKE